MRLNITFELSLVLDAEKFRKVLARAYNNSEFFDESEGRCVDQSLADKGIMVTYRDSQYKKKVKLIVNQNLVTGSGEPDPDRLVHKLEKRIDSYFSARYRLDDFDLTGMIFATDIDVCNRENVSAYLKVLQRIGKVKGFSPSGYDCFDNVANFCLDGKSNGISFLIYDLEGLRAVQLMETDLKHKQMKSILEKSEGILRAEVRLTKPKAIQLYTDTTVASEQIAELSKKGKEIFLDTFMHIVPFGDFYKKCTAVEIIRKEVTDNTLKRKMLYLLALIPEKKSLLLAQKALNYRRIDDVMDKFADIEVSPVTISKRHGIRKLNNLYKYMGA